MFELFFFGILAGLLYAVWYWWPTSMWVVGAFIFFRVIADECRWWRVDRHRARSSEERRRSYLADWAARMAMPATANKLEGVGPAPKKQVLFWEGANLVLWLAIFGGAIVSITKYSAEIKQEENYAAGYDDGYAVGYDTTCELRSTSIDGDWESPDYRSGYEAGYSDGAQECLVSQRGDM